MPLERRHAMCGHEEQSACRSMTGGYDSQTNAFVALRRGFYRASAAPDHGHVHTSRPVLLQAGAKMGGESSHSPLPARRALADRPQGGRPRARGASGGAAPCRAARALRLDPSVVPRQWSACVRTT
jgi:hypothetical protein